MKHGLVLEFLRSDEIFEIWSNKLTGQQASKTARQQGSIHPDTIVTRKVAPLYETARLKMQIRFHLPEFELMDSINKNQVNTTSAQVDINCVESRTNQEDRNVPELTL